MALKSQLIEMLHANQQRLQQFAAGLPAKVRNDPGSWESWSAKDQIAHVAHWLDFDARHLLGIDTQFSDDLDEANAQTYHRYHDAPWDEVLALADGAYTALVSFVESQSEDELRGPDELLNRRGRPLWQTIAGGQTHAQMHLATYWLHNEEPDKAAEIYLEAAEQARGMDDSPAWQGVQDYNTACAYAFSGRREQAMASLRKAFAARPDLRDFAPQDSDLQSLFSDPEFIALTQPEDLQNG